MPPPPQIFKEAQDLLPGGVNSPVRAFKSVGGQPIIFDHVKGAYCFDVDANKYIDYVGSWGPAIVGHSNKEVNDALIKQIEKGTSFGAPCELEVGRGVGGGGRGGAPCELEVGGDVGGGGLEVGGGGRGALACLVEGWRRVAGRGGGTLTLVCSRCSRWGGPGASSSLITPSS